MSSKNIKAKVYNFFEQPSSFFGQFVRWFIILLILYSGAEFLVEYIKNDFYLQYERFFYITEMGVVIIFTLEYLLRLWSSPKKGKFVINFYNIIDVVAILPFYLSLIFLSIFNMSGIRVIRLIRLLRLTRVFRLTKAMKYSTDGINQNKLSAGKIVQENIIKNFIILVILMYSYHFIRDFFLAIDPVNYSDILFASSIFALAAMFGFFAFSYDDTNPLKTSDRILAHMTSGLLLLPIGIMFIIAQVILTINIGQPPVIIIGSTWLVYIAVLLWDFMNVKKVKKFFEK